MTEYDEDGWAVPGTYAISTVRIAGAKADGAPVATITSAVCDVCHGWASRVYTSGTELVLGDIILDVRVRRRTQVIVYACPEHAAQVSDALCDEYGHCVGGYAADELAAKVAAMAAPDRSGALDG